jgi:hypothetical protein
MVPSEFVRSARITSGVIEVSFQGITVDPEVWRAG